jgi:hypothetical protein
VAGVAALWWQAVRQSDAPANATVVRGKLLGGAQAKGFSPAVYPSDRGAGRVLAPQDGLAAVAERPTRRALQPLGEPAWANGAIRKVVGSDFEPISFDFGGVRAAVPGGRKNLC